MAKDFGKIPVPGSNGSFQFITPDDIEYLNSDDQTTHIFLTNGKKVIGYKNMGHFEKLLENYPFERVHTKWMVNLSKITGYLKEDAGILIMESDKRIPIARRRSEALMRILKKIEHEDEGDDPDATTRGIAVLVVERKDTPGIYPIKPGKQLVGRSSIAKPCEIMITTDDKTMGRNHFFVEANEKEKDRYEFVAYMNDPSNITYINKELMKHGKKYALEDETLILAGNTRIIFKSLPTGNG